LLVTELTDFELKDGLSKAALRTRRLIVLDGVWSMKVWDDLKAAFPTTNPMFASKLLLARRIDEVAKHTAKDVYIHSLKPLDDVASTDLFKEKVETCLRLYLCRKRYFFNKFNHVQGTQ